jgi:DNA (cytosine-5)-methyltransferase 1
MSTRSSKTGGSRSKEPGGRALREQPGMILDLFAGAGGWEHALGMLGLSALGVETDHWACETARAAGHERLQADVAELDPRDLAPVWGLVGSPPCQAYSTAGKGLGRLDKPLLIACAHELAAGDDSRKAWREGCRDPRSLLTVEPLRYALALRPRWIALEQVPGVLELWSLFAGLLGACGYHTATGVLSAERYGVPQTRKRAFLIASLDGPVSLPEPTHRSYDTRKQEMPESERELLPWVSMAEALGWTSDAIVQTNNQTKGGRHPRGLTRPVLAPARTLDTQSGSWTIEPCVQTRRGGPRITEGRDPTRAPSPTITTRVSRWHAQGITPTDVALRNGNQANAAIRVADDPAPTVHFGARVNQVEWVPACLDGRQRAGRPRRVREPAPTMLAAGLAKGVPVWTRERPATTIACDQRVHPNGHEQNANDAPGRYQQRRDANAARVTVCQAAVLQGFPADYPWQGSRTRQFEQIGNAVPPPFACSVLEQAIRPSASKRRPRRRG